ncbi:intermembrane phospholipid transport protein YdbH family protein [Sphingomonas mollis]|uniref:YdbH domain-containing protein n=1 Tax=Sphingomonas mollis TaxID=2795726 RepID=A0ABS0XKW3_9SPHN|nr:YdbH domain-containing protein [Sphingomonas sp. BT553]
MDETDDHAPLPERPPRRKRRLALAAALSLSTVLGILWIERRPILTHFVDRELTRRQVPARYTVADLGIGRQRLTNVSIGDPANPDLTADWVETRVALSPSGPYLVGVAAGRVSLRGKLVDGKVSLGAIDRLLPPPSGKPFALPSLNVDVEDAQIRLATPAGPVALAITGRGKLDDGFAGRIRLAAPRLATGPCIAIGTAASMQIRITRAQPHLVGPVSATRIQCDATTVTTARADLDVALSAALDRWRGEARVATAAGSTTGARIAASHGQLTFAGTARQVDGTITATADRPQLAQGNAGRLTIDGRYQIGAHPQFTGRAAIVAGGVDPLLLRQATSWRDAAAGTPLAPLVAKAGAAIAAAGGRFDAVADLRVSSRSLALSRIAIDTASGARLTQWGATAIDRTGVRLDGQLIVGGGGLPGLRVSLSQAAAGAPIHGRAIVDPYTAETARLALSPVTFSATPGGATRIATQATLSGPIGNGRVDGLTAPISLFWDGRRRVVVNPSCTPVTIDVLTLAGLTLDPARSTLCPTGPALVTLDGNRLAGGARLAATTLAGRLGGTPLTLTIAGGEGRLGRPGFTLTDVAARLGSPDRLSRLDIATLAGTMASGRVTGRYDGAGGQIGNVPLILSAAAGDWTLAGGTLALTSALTVSDQATTPRFRPLAARDVALTLAGDRIDVTGTLHEPTTGTRVATVAILHRLSIGTGTADLAVPALAFGDGFQPDLLTPLTFGVVADVRGTVDGTGHIAWSPAGVTSTGDFGTAALDLAAAFGPATGIATRVRFDDLLGLHTPPGQVATIRTVNPGIAVQDGTVNYQLLGPSQVQVEGARWPFAGGALTLDPSRLTFDGTSERRLTFRVDGARADQFLQQFDFENLNATGTFDGILPMIFDESGGRIENGQLAMREGGGTIAYVGALGQEQLGVWGDLAFQALKSLRYRSLALTLNGPLAGEMVTDVRFAGISQGQGAKSNFLVRRLQKLPFVFNVRIKAPFRGLLDSAQSFYDPRRLIQRNLPALLEQQRRAGQVQPPTISIPTLPTPAIQPSASETMR